jgi:excisionase family DNA binding protein
LPNSTGYTRGKNPNSHRNKPKVKAGEITVRLTQPALNYLAQFKNKTQVVEDLILAAAANAESKGYQELLPMHKVADFLNVPPHYVAKLLSQGELPFVMVGEARCVSLATLTDYRQSRDFARRQKLGELTNFLQEEGFYDLPSTGEPNESN